MNYEMSKYAPVSVEIFVRSMIFLNRAFINHRTNIGVLYLTPECPRVSTSGVYAVQESVCESGIQARS